MLESSRIRFLPHTKRVAPRDNSRPSSQYQQVVEVLGCCVRLPSTNPPPQICFSALAGARRKEQGQSRGGSHYSSESHLPWPPNCGHTLRLYSASQAQLYNIKLAYQQCLNNGWLQASRKYFCFFIIKKQVSQLVQMCTMHVSAGSKEMSDASMTT